MKRKCIIVDIDNTLGFDKIKTDIPNSDKREDWNKFHEEHEFYNPNNFEVYKDVVNIVSNFNSQIYNNPMIIFMTARENALDGKIFTNTNRLLMRIFDFIEPREYNIDYMLLMRLENDFRKDWEVKKDLYNEFIKDKFEPIIAIDDKIENINTFKELGVPMLLHVNKGVYYEK